jgi:hypothetical protein
MKKLYLLSGLLVLLHAVRGQELTVSPAFPQDTSTVTITVNCTLGNQGLLTAGGTGVYAYMGLITSSSTSSSDWLYVPRCLCMGHGQCRRRRDLPGQ